MQFVATIGCGTTLGHWMPLYAMEHHRTAEYLLPSLSFDQSLFSYDKLAYWHFFLYMFDIAQPDKPCTLSVISDSFRIFVHLFYIPIQSVYAGIREIIAGELKALN